MESRPGSDGDTLGSFLGFMAIASGIAGIVGAIVGVVYGAAGGTVIARVARRRGLTRWQARLVSGLGRLAVGMAVDVVAIPRGGPGDVLLGLTAAASVAAAMLGARVVFAPEPRISAWVDRRLRADSDDAVPDGNTAL